ncbi:hypothetical protein HDU67_009630 [Dinochytrium kinnereticum]|nr:hypothetical protein HDU67_009630 [Dinochytrium kinnereticum]
MTTKRKDNSLYHDIGSWSGRLVSDEARGAAIFKAYELRQLAIHREVEGHESYFFLSNFKTIRYSENSDTCPTAAKNRESMAVQATKPKKPAFINYHLTKPGPSGAPMSSLTVPVGNSARSSVSTGPLSTVAASNASVTAQSNTSTIPPGAINQAPNPPSFGHSNAPTITPTLLRFRKANTVRPGAPPTTTFIESIPLIPSPPDPPKSSDPISTESHITNTITPPLQMTIPKKDWTPEKQAVYVFDGPSYVWLLFTAVVEKGREAQGAGTAGGLRGYAVESGSGGKGSLDSGSPAAIFAFERAAASEWAKELAHSRGHMRFEIFDETEPTQKAFWESIGVIIPQEVAPIEAPKQLDGSPTPEEHGTTTAEIPTRASQRTFTRSGTEGLKTGGAAGGDRNVSIEIPSTPHVTKMLYKATDMNVIRTVQFEEVAKGSKLRSSLLVSGSVMFLDARDCFYVWVGGGSGLKREALGLAEEFLVRTARPFDLPIVRVDEGGESEWFLSNFEICTEKGEGNGVTAIA